MKHHLNLTEKQALVTRYTGGETVSAICMETGISKSTLYLGSSSTNLLELGLVVS